MTTGEDYCTKFDPRDVYDTSGHYLNKTENYSVSIRLDRLHGSKVPRDQGSKTLNQSTIYRQGPKNISYSIGIFELLIIIPSFQNYSFFLIIDIERCNKFIGPYREKRAEIYDDYYHKKDYFLDLPWYPRYQPYKRNLKGPIPIDGAIFK